MADGQHSPQIGWMADGFPLYGPLGPNGVVMQTCTVTGGTVGTSVCLDACGGYLAATGDGFAYRYYMPGTFNSGQCNGMPAPAPVGGGANYYPQSPTCLRGCCPSGVTCSMGSVNLPMCSNAATAGTTATFVATTANALPINSAAVSSASSAAAQRATLCCSSANIASVSTSPTPTQACTTLGHCAVDDCVYSTSATLPPPSSTIITNVAGTPIQYPIEYSSTATEFTVNLTLSRYLYNGPNGLQQWTRAYNNELSGPTIRVKPGDTLHIRLTNNLANELYDTSSLHNNFKDFDTTNVHTHGLHIHGETPGDNIFTSVHAGSTYEYTYEIPANHMGGIHWYHPHHHGSASI